MVQIGVAGLVKMKQGSYQETGTLPLENNARLRTPFEQIFFPGFEGTKAKKEFTT